MSSSSDIRTVETYRFSPEDLNVSRRLPGVSAFMRIKNGADFLEAAIRSHIHHLDEIVAVHNQCTDDSPAILERLAAEFPGKLRVIHYTPAVYPPGSEGHAREPADSPRSFVNQSNLALAETRHQIVMKLDDDHVAIGDRFAALAASVRRNGASSSNIVCFSGINVAAADDGRVGVLRADPFAGAGDHFFFAARPDRYFVHHDKFEDFAHNGRRVFGDLTYWHLKHLKPGYGFANRDIESGSNPRFARKREAFLANRQIGTLADLREDAPRFLLTVPPALLPEKARLRADRWRRFLTLPPDEADLTAAVEAAQNASQPGL